MNQTDLFVRPSSGWEEFLPEPTPVRLFRGFLNREEADGLLNELVKSVPWRQDKIKIFGKNHDLPRLQQWYGDVGQVYRWSGIEMKPLPWTDELIMIRDRIQSKTEHEFNSVLINYYRDGNDTVGWHADDEPGLGDEPFIASLSLGATRDFLMRKMFNKTERIKAALDHGSLLTMGGRSQKIWQHSIPRRKNINSPRINMTFRMFDL